MVYFYWAFFIIALFAGIAMTVREGIWSNTLTLVNICLSGLIAFGFYSWIVIYLDEQVTEGQHTYWLDFCVLWALFCASMVILRTFTGFASKTKMRFKNPIDPVGGPLMGVLASFVMASFLLATLHTSPMAKDAFGGKLVYSDPKSASPFSQPDSFWLCFVEKMSQGDVFGGGSSEVFRSKNFVDTYANHRERFGKATSFIVKRPDK